VLIPGAPLVPILFLSQALNAVLLLAILPFMRPVAAEAAIMGDERLSGGDRIATAAVIALIAISVAVLTPLSIA
jgi:Mn2+/Fe2+ NRAMP family transporter